MPATKIVFTEKKLARFVADVTRHAMGSRAFNAALAARGRWQAMCGDHFLTTWFGPCRQTEKEAKADAKAHNAANPAIAGADAAAAVAIRHTALTLRAHEKDRLPLLRPLDSVAAVANANGVRRAAAIHRPRGRRRGARRRRRVLPRASLCPPARLALPAPGRRRRADQAHRDRHRGHRHALREPDVYGGGRRCGRHHQRRAPAARHQPRLARAGDRRLALFWLRAAGRRDRRRHGAAPHRGFSRGFARARFCKTQSAADVCEPAGPAAARAVFGRVARAHLVGRGLERHRRVGRQNRHEPAELDAGLRRDRRAARHPAGGPDPEIPRGLEGGRTHARSRGCRSAAASSRW